jgi:hypothetical protein
VEPRNSNLLFRQNTKYGLKDGFLAWSWTMEKTALKVKIKFRGTPKLKSAFQAKHKIWLERWFFGLVVDDGKNSLLEAFFCLGLKVEIKFHTRGTHTSRCPRRSSSRS